jgi:hypothetical protein
MSIERRNQITATIYTSGVTVNTSAYIILDDIQDVRFATGYPGGMCLDASFYVPRDIQLLFPMAGGERVVFRNGTVLVYEGYVSAFERRITPDGMGTAVTLMGAWGWHMMSRRWYKIWADARVDETAWKWVAGYSGGDKVRYEIERTNRLALGCKQSTEYLADTVIGAVEYVAKDGETIKRITYDYEILDSGATPDFQFSVYRSDPSPAEVATSVQTSGTGAFDYTFVTPCNKVELRLTPITASVPFTTGSGDYWWAIITKLCVYTEVNDPFYIYDLGQDLIGHLTVLNSSTQYCNGTVIDTSLKLLGQPSSAYGDSEYPNSFGAFGFETCADILAMGARYGRGSTYDYGRIGYGLYPSSFTDESDGKPALFVEAYPDTSTAYDYLIGLDDLNLQAPFSVAQDFASVRNYVIVHYIDNEGAERYYTPNDNAALKDTASIALYGQREAIMDVGYADTGTAVEAGVRHLNYYKDPKYILTGPIRVFDYLEDQYGAHVPVSQVWAGSILRLRNWFSATADANNRLAFVITHVEYDDVSNSASLTAGPPPELIYPAYIRPIVYTPLVNEQRQTPDQGGGRGGDDDQGGYNDPKLKLLRGIQQGEGYVRFRPGGKPLVRPTPSSGGLSEEFKG